MTYMKALKPQVRKGGPEQGYYTPVNPMRYAADDKTIIYRSSLELEMCKFCDTDPSVIKWISEPDMPIMYNHPFKRKMAKYFPDFYIQFVSTMTVERYLNAIVELKAHNMMYLPEHGDFNRLSTFQKKAFLINQAKKKAAEIWCASRNMKYLVITEKSSFFKKRGR